MPAPIACDRSVEQMIFPIRGQRVMVDRDLAALYGVSTKRLNEQIKRNKKRFPPDFLFKLTRLEMQELVANCDRLKSMKHSSVAAHVFTEQGIAMLSSVLHSDRAVQVNIAIMRAFVRLRRAIEAHKELGDKLKELEGRVGKHDKEIRVIFEAIRQLVTPPPKPKTKIGFHK